MRVQGARGRRGVRRVVGGMGMSEVGVAIVGVEGMEGVEGMGVVVGGVEVVESEFFVILFSLFFGDDGADVAI